VIVELYGMQVFGRHGYLDEERRAGQRFLVDLWVDVDEAASTSDAIDETVDYRLLAGLVGEVFGGEPHLLLESLAGTIADLIVARFAAVTHVRVRVRKPDVVLDPPVEHSAVIVERER
jgi:dihydroneopterin aldolase